MEPPHPIEVQEVPPILRVEVATVPAQESVELLDGGDRAYPAMLSAIALARNTIDLRSMLSLRRASAPASSKPWAMRHAEV